MNIIHESGNAVDGWVLKIECDHEEYVTLLNLRNELDRNKVRGERLRSPDWKESNSHEPTD